jgi:hypothetical protein
MISEQSNTRNIAQVRSKSASLLCEKIPHFQKKVQKTKLVYVTLCHTMSQSLQSSDFISNSHSSMHMHESGTLSPPIAASASLHSNQAGLFAPSVRLGMSSPSCNSCGHLLHSPQTPCKVATPPAPVWRKILYEAQPFEDNYTPSTFLSSAELNPNLQHHTFRRMYAFFVC